MAIIACSRIFYCSIIAIFLGLLLFLILPAYHHHHHHASVGFFGGYPDYHHHHASAVVGGDVLRRRRKMIAAGPHASPTSPGNLQKLLYPRRPPSLGTTKNTSLDGTTDDVTKTKIMRIISSTSTGKHNDRESGLAATPPRRRRLISASPSNSQPSPGYPKHAVP